MINATQQGFKERPEDRSIIFVGKHGAKQLAHNAAITDCDTVTLKTGDASVIVEDIRVESGGYKGRVKGFEPPSISGPHGLREDEEILFQETHVFTGGVQE